MIPRRIQRRRTKGWTMPPGAIYVGRPTKWGNPYRVGATFHVGPAYSGRDDTVRGHAHAVRLYRKWIFNLRSACDVPELRGHDLACWCGLCDTHRDGLPLGVECPDCQPCHADVLLEIANS